MNVNLSYEELDELLHYARVECDFAAGSARQAREAKDRALGAERFANARYLMERLEAARGERKPGRDRYLLEGAEAWAERFAHNFREPAPVLSIVREG